MKSWQPILTGELAARAWEAVDAIAAALDPDAAAADPASAPVPPLDSPAGAPDNGPSLAGGSAGEALFFAYRARSTPSRRTPGDGRPQLAETDGTDGADGTDGTDGADDLDRAAALLERSTSALATIPLSPDLYGGFSGVAWTAEHLYGPHFADPSDLDDPETTAEAQGDDHGDDDDPLAEIDKALLGFLARTPWIFDYDLIRGLGGFAVYGLERLPRPSALSCLEAVVDRLEETAERGPQGTTWFTAPDLLPDWQRELNPNGYYNVGVAHGMPAIVAVAAAIHAAATRLSAAGDPANPSDRAAGLLAARARTLAEDAVRWLTAHRLPAGSVSIFGSTFSESSPMSPSRLAWCYGDPGIATALLVAARACDEPAWEELALEVARKSAERTIESSMVRDAGLCHGAAGLGHLFNRLYQETGDELMARASRIWFEKALDFRRPGTGVAGFQSFWMTETGVTESWRDDASLLEGAAGIGLALLGALSSFEPAWDRIMLMSAATEPVTDPSAS
jgi:hypothetical protein